MDVIVDRYMTIKLDTNEVKQLSNFCRNALDCGYTSTFDRSLIEQLYRAIKATEDNN